ncbi:hypothetical protein [Chitinophaga sp. sic0106]|uniref:hypothetical protein n=1 Tax=Chitinophaga sp. sic0106 TaxID=2854785 RepID=UPI001C47E5AD|nr:hypothetical protein [Chitinophaga sp. sic0106]MBV7531340.1 hypothetical protein [Chitinophaga sp. sic0106]
MPNFSATNLVKAQALLKKRFTEAEMRTKQSAYVTLGQRNLDVLIPSHESLRTRDDRPVEANILARSKRATTNSRTYNHTGNRGDSFVLPLVWTTFTDKFSISLKQMDNNVHSFDETLSQQLLNCATNIYEGIETYGIDLLYANRTQINTAATGGSFNAANDAFEIAATDKPRFYQLAKSMMRQNNYSGTFDVIASPQTYVDGEFYANQGGGNSTNTNFQFTGLNIVESVDLEDSNYTGGVSLIMPAGSFALLPWIPKQNRNGHGDYNSVLGGYGSIQNPLGYNYPLALHAYAERADTSAQNGNSQDDVMQFELSVDIATVISPLSTATESVVFEVAQLVA